METISFMGHAMSVDAEATRSAYTTYPGYFCSCETCTTYLPSLPDLMPERFSQLLHTLGIDATKPLDIDDVHPGGSYQFVGRFAHPDSLSDGGRNPIHTTPKLSVSNSFKIQITTEPCAVDILVDIEWPEKMVLHFWT